MARALDEALRREPGRVLSVLIRALGDFDLAEDALQEAITLALERWAADGTPANPAGWLVTTARRRGIDRVRRTASWERKAAELRVLEELEREGEADPDPDPEREVSIPDERLRLIFTCCHPALPMESRVALTLRTVGGLSTAEVARAFLCGEDAMKKRLTRTKARIRAAGIPYTVPSDALLAERLGGVLAVLYVIFNEGYAPATAASDDGNGPGEEAIRLAQLVQERIPEPESTGLLALMLYQHSRRRARTADDGRLVLLDDQDRRLWDRGMITEAHALLEAAAAHRRPGPYQLQAAIAREHASARRPEDTDWARIAELYDRLLEISPSPVLALNRAVAHDRAFGAEVGLALLDAIEGLQRSHLLLATRADLLRRLGRIAEAREAYRAALDIASDPSERAFLADRLAECEGE